MRKYNSDFWKNARVSTGLSQDDVATSLGYSSPQMVSNWERGLCTPPNKVLKKLLVMYNINVDDFIKSYIDAERDRLRKQFNLKKSTD